ncbi:MAG TPA: hypothetical protein VKU01_25060 [Bryobacteraceae bacterium]|nr:hypothetical protein [Bryobacteraceae bacterium]
MPSYAVRIGDVKGVSFRIRLEGGGSGLTGKWRALDLGAIKYEKGTTLCRDTAGTWFDSDMFICKHENEICIRLDDFMGVFDWQKEDGTGEVMQHCCIALQPGKITWVWEQTS